MDAVVVLPLRKELKRRLQAPCGDPAKKPVPITQVAFENERERGRWQYKAPDNLLLVAAI